MSDVDIHAHIDALIAEEHSLRSRLSAGAISREEEHRRLADLEGRLDQLWDLLRNRQAKREFGENPDDAQERPESVVEHYEQ